MLAVAFYLGRVSAQARAESGRSGIHSASPRINGLVLQGRPGIVWWIWLTTRTAWSARAHGFPRLIRICSSYILGVVGPAKTLRRHPCDVLRGVFNIAGFAVHTVLRIDLENAGRLPPRLSRTPRPGNNVERARYFGRFTRIGIELSFSVK